MMGFMYLFYGQKAVKWGMATTITLTGDLEKRFWADALREGVPLETVVTRRLEEAELIHRILSYFPAEETRQVRSLIARRGARTITETEQEQLTKLIHAREERTATRFTDILALAKLRGVSSRTVMAELGIRPARLI